MTPTLRIVGAGHAGLAVGYFAVRAGWRVEIYEEQSRVGGLLETVRVPSGLVERAANGFVATPLVREVAADIGIDLIPTERAARARYLWREGRLRRWPLGFFETIGALFRFATARLRYGTRAPRAQETVAAWGRRIFGAAFTKHLIGVGLQGVYASDAERLSATLIAGHFFATRKGPRARATMAPRDGMGAWTQALERSLVAKGVTFHRGERVSPEALAAWASPVVVATPVQAAASVVAQRAPRAAELLRAVRRLPLWTVTQFFRRTGHEPRGFGALIPRGAGFRTLGILFNDDIFAGRVADANLRSETWIVEGDAPEGAWVAERNRLWGRGDVPLETVVTRWPDALPDYTLELEATLPELVAAAESGGVYLHGNYLGQLSLAKMLERAQDLVARLPRQKGTSA